MNDSIKESVRRAISECRPEEGVPNHLKRLVLEGYRSAITDLLMDELANQEATPETKGNALTVLYYLHGTGTALFFGQHIPNPRRENATLDERMTHEQLNRLLDLGLQERQPGVLGEFVALLDVLHGSVPLAPDLLAKAKRFVTHCCLHGDTYAAQRAQSMLKHK